MTWSPQKTTLPAGEATTVNGACPIKSPFTAVQGLDGTNGQTEEAHHASHDASEPEGDPLNQSVRVKRVVR